MCLKKLVFDIENTSRCLINHLICVQNKNVIMLNKVRTNIKIKIKKSITIYGILMAI